MNEEYRQQDIPTEFHSYATGAPFSHCIECDRSLENMEYFIEKAIRTYPGYDATDVIFELAICIQCAEAVRKSMSEDSQLKIAEYMQANADASRQIYVINEYPDSPDKWTANCLITGKSKNAVSEYQIYAHCHGDQLIPDIMPYMISGSVLDELSQLLSNKTLGEMDNFMGRHFGPPSLEKDLPRHRTILV